MFAQCASYPREILTELAPVCLRMVAIMGVLRLSSSSESNLPCLGGVAGDLMYNVDALGNGRS